MALHLHAYDLPEELPVREDTYLPSREGESFYVQGSGSRRSQSQTLPGLWREFAEDLPSATPEMLWKEEVLGEAAGYSLLRSAKGRSADDMFAALRRLDSEAVDLEPSTRLEEELLSLRESLRSREIWSPEARRLETARRASGRREIHLAFVPTPSKQLGLFLQNLGASGEVHLHALLSRAMIEPYLRLLGVTATIHDHTSGRCMPFGEPGQPDRDIRMIKGSSSLEAEAIVSPSPLSDWRRIWPRMEEEGFPLLFRTDVAARDSRLGSELLGKANVGLEELGNLLPDETMSEEDLLWAEACLREGEGYSGDTDLFLESVFSRRVWRGSGAPLLAPGEVPLLAPRRLLFWGLEDTRYPRPVSPSLFFSEESYARYPELGAKDQRPAFVATLLAARESILLLREGEPSSFWLEAERVWGIDPEEGHIRGGRSLLRAQAKRRAQTPTLDLLQERLETEDPEPPKGGSFSITELESYLRCPLGWFVDYRLRPRRTSPEAEEGSRLHRFMEEAQESPERGEELLEEFSEEWKNPLRIALQEYNWPVKERYLEVPLQVSLDMDGEEIVLRGRADRIDIRQEGLLVLDWKRGRPPAPEKSLQAALYPWMASERFSAEPLGMVFVSLRTGESRSLLSRALPEVEADLGWKAWSRKASGRAEEAIRGIRSGDWQRRGQRCPSWCAHHLYSRTRHA